MFAQNTRITETELTCLVKYLVPMPVFAHLDLGESVAKNLPKTLLMPYGIWCNTPIDFSLGLISVIFLNPKPQNY